MALWVDKHRPKSVEELDLHGDVNRLLKHVVANRDFPHLLFHGPPGSGKKTRVMAILRSQFGDDVMSVRLEHKAVSVNDSKTVEISTISSKHHIDLNPSDVGSTYDRVIVMDTIREIAATVPLAVPGTSSASHPGFKVVILNEVDRLSRSAQQALRRTMEKYVTTCRLILICNSTSRLIAPLRSRCLPVRVPAVDPVSMVSVMSVVLTREGLKASPAFLNAVATKSEGNLRRGLLMLEASKMSKCNMEGDGSDVPVAEWRVFLNEIANDILQEQTPKKLHDIRLKLYDLLAQCIPADVIFRHLLEDLLGRVHPSIQVQLIAFAAQFNHNMSLGSKPVMHLEAFVAHAMVLCRQAAVGRLA